MRAERRIVVVYRFMVYVREQAVLCPGRLRARQHLEHAATRDGQRERAALLHGAFPRLIYSFPDLRADGIGVGQHRDA